MRNKKDVRSKKRSSNPRKQSDRRSKFTNSKRDSHSKRVSHSKETNLNSKKPSVAAPRRSKGKKKIGAKPTVMTPTSWSAKGEAVVTINNKRTLVWAGIAHEEAVVQLTHKGQHQHFGHFVRADNPSSVRREAPCVRFDRCQGCPLMHVEEEAQRAIKLQMFKTHMDGLDIDDVLPTEVIAEGEPERYRYVSKLAAGKARHGAFRLGARNRNGEIIPIPDCLVTTPELNEVGKRIAYLATDMNIFPYTSERPSGLRHVVMRQSRSEQTILVTLVATARSRFLEELAEEIFTTCTTVSGVMLHINNEAGNAIFARDDGGAIRYQKLEGRATITEKIGAISYHLGPGDFFQINPFIAERLQRDVIEISKTFAGHPMVDLYSGVGFFSTALAKEHGWAMGIEAVASAVARARYAAEDNRVRVDFRVGEVIEELFDLDRVLNGASPCFVVDPARRGLEEGVIDEILSQNPAGIIYVSCSPKTLARDIQMFKHRNWTVQKSQVYDMFPQTVHLEALVVLKPPSGTPVQKRRPPRRIMMK